MAMNQNHQQALNQQPNQHDLLAFLRNIKGALEGRAGIEATRLTDGGVIDEIETAAMCLERAIDRLNTR